MTDQDNNNYGVPAAAHPTKIGPYRVLDVLGEGGMAVVYLAEQLEPVKRRVALKILKPGMDTKQVVARFESERQALAVLDHPNIASIFDGGVADSGRPYFVMELVKGVPITDYCDEQRLRTEQRIRLFLDVCAAVQHAHLKGLIHRDLKPSNILVGVVDGKPQAKVIDFGIAKATSTTLTEATLYTRLGQLIGTPQYMSPEQANLTGLDVDTRTDVYSLGVVLYELLVGAVPIDLTGIGDQSMQVAIREKEPSKPSTRIKELGDTQDEIAKARNTDIHSLRRQLRGDLDWIVMRAIEKDRTRRYETVNALWMECQRFLNREPVLARPPSAGYLLQRFVQRNRLAVLAASITIVAVCVGATASVLGYLRAKDAELVARQESARANRVAEFLKELLAASKPSNARGEDVTVRQVLDAGVEKVRSELDEPELKASLLEIMGDVYTDLGDFQQAEQLLLESIDIHRETGDPLALAAALDEFGQLLRSRGDWQASVSVMEEALAYARRVSGEASLEVQANILNSLGFSASKLNRFGDAEKYHREALALRRELFGPEDVVTSQSLSSLGFLLYKTGQYDESVELMAAALRIAERELGPYHPVISTRALNLSSAYLRTGRFSEAERLIRKAIEIDEYVYGPDHHFIASGLLNLAALYREQLDFERAAKTLQQALPIETAALGDRHVDTGHTRATLAYYYSQSGNFQDAEELITIAQEIFDEAALGEHQYKLQLLKTRGALMQANGSYAEALAYYEEALEMATRMYGPDHHRTDLIAGAARAHSSLSQFQRAFHLYAETIELMQRESPGSRPALIRVREEYADVLERAGEHDKAQAIRKETTALVELASQQP